MGRPNYVPAEVWLGIKVGEWPIQAFPSQEMAAKWAADSEMNGRRKRFWKVEIPDDVKVYSSTPVPATTSITEVDW